jgi:hypothetical protein
MGPADLPQLAVRRFEFSYSVKLQHYSRTKLYYSTLFLAFKQCRYLPSCVSHTIAAPAVMLSVTLKNIDAIAASWIPVHSRREIA